MAFSTDARSDKARAAPPLGLYVPPASPGVCSRCHGPTRHGECWCCRRVGTALEEATRGVPVFPVALCRPGDELHAALRRYKDAPAQSARHHYVSLLGRSLHRHLLAHHRCLLGLAGPWDALAVVPSSGRGGVACPSPRPFESVVAAVPALAAFPRIPLVRGPQAADHLRPAPGAFAVASHPTGQRVLLLEDAWVTGARARSAVAALSQAGAVVVGVVVAGRVVDPSASASVGAWWVRQVAGAAGRAGRCCAVGCAGNLTKS
jgi:hypothetical protein